MLSLSGRDAEGADDPAAIPPVNAPTGEPVVLPDGWDGHVEGLTFHRKWAPASHIQPLPIEDSTHAG